MSGAGAAVCGGPYSGGTLGERGPRAAGVGEGAPDMRTEYASRF